MSTRYVLIYNSYTQSPTYAHTSGDIWFISSGLLFIGINSSIFKFYFLSAFSSVIFPIFPLLKSSIIIFAVFRYKDWYNIDIESCFNQKYIGTILDKHNGKIPEFIHKHIKFVISDDGEPKPHLLLHTNHFAMRSNDFIEAVANECKKFMDEYGISIDKSVK